MIKLKSLIMEMNPDTRPDSTLDAFLLENRVETISDHLYHGSPFDGLQSMLLHGMWGTEHGEVSEHESFSTSLNAGILHYFSEGDGETGIEFKVNNLKVIVLDEVMAYLVTRLAGSGYDPEVDEETIETFCKNFNVPIGGYRHDYFLPYNYLSSLGVDAFMYEYAWKRYRSGNIPYNDESEVCIIGSSIEKMNNFVYTIYVDGDEFDVDDKAAALRAVQEKIDAKA